MERERILGVAFEKVSFFSAREVESEMTKARFGQGFVGVTFSSTVRTRFAKTHTASCPKAGFTLAEVLITLGIIGIVAAMTLPTLVGHYKKEETISKLKKAYTIVNQAMKRSEVDNGEYVHWDSGFDVGAENYINKYWVPYFNVTKICLKYSDCGYNSNVPFKRLSGDSDGLNVTHNLLRIPFLTSDGIMYSISITSGDATVAEDLIYIDINGAKGPNVFGKDLFVFTREEGKTIIPLCNNSSDASINTNCSANGAGTCCAKKIMNDGWKINYKF